MDWKKKRVVLVNCIAVFMIGCTASKQMVAKEGVVVMQTPHTVAMETDSIPKDNFLEDLLQQYPQYFDSILASRKVNNVQFIYTKIDRGANGIAALQQHCFNLDTNACFDPGAAINLPLGLLTLQKMGEVKTTGIDQNSTMLTETAYTGQTAAFNDPTVKDGKPSLAQYLKKSLLTGDETASDRLYEFGGQQYLNDQLRKKGYKAQIIRRQSVLLSEDENRHTNPIKFVGPGNRLIYQQPPQFNQLAFLTCTDSLGQSYHPTEPQVMNHVTLQELHTMLISLVFANKVTATQRFAISTEDRKFLLRYMSQLPTESWSPPYADDTTTYYPAYNKFLLYGAAKGSIPTGIRSFNAAGEMGGQLVDVAYIVDFDKKIEFFLSAVIHCGNDSKAGYDTVGYPFFKHLGQVIYDYELKREKQVTADLSELMLDYGR